MLNKILIALYLFLLSFNVYSAELNYCKTTIIENDTIKPTFCLIFDISSSELIFTTSSNMDKSYTEHFIYMISSNGDTICVQNHDVEYELYTTHTLPNFYQNIYILPFYDGEYKIVFIFKCRISKNSRIFIIKSLRNTLYNIPFYPFIFLTKYDNGESKFYINNAAMYFKGDMNAIFILIPFGIKQDSIHISITNLKSEIMYSKFCNTKEYRFFLFGTDISNYECGSYKFEVSVDYMKIYRTFHIVPISSFENFLNQYSKWRYN